MSSLWGRGSLELRLLINILGGWKGYVSGWAYELELNTSICDGAIPEPASTVLLAGRLALAAVGARRRHQRAESPKQNGGSTIGLATFSTVNP